MIRGAQAPAACLALLALLAACGGGGGSGPGGQAYPTPSPRGKLLGLSSALTIGAEGGSLVSPDGLLTVTIPAGATPGPVSFTIDEITNTAPGAVDPTKAYRIGPEGTVFALPVTLQFVAAQAGESLAGLTVAYQERQGFWLRYRDTALVRDTIGGTLTVTSLHFSDWSVVKRSTRDLDGIVTVSSTLGMPFTATGSATLNFAAEDASGAYYLQWGNLTLDSPILTSGISVCSATQPAFDLDASIAEVMATPAFRFGLTGRWPLSCSDAGGPAYDSLLTLQFDTLGIYHPECTRVLAPGSIVSQDQLQGQYTLDCGTAGSVLVNWNLTTVVQRRPVALADVATVSENGSVVVSVLANDTILNPPATVTIAGAPLHGTAVANADGTVTYTPSAGYFGSDTLTYQVTDAFGQTATATVSVTVASFPPVAVADTAAVPENGSAVLNVLANDTVTGGVASVTVATTPLHGTAVVNADRTISYTPVAGYFGPDTFTYQVTDTFGQAATATVSVTVMPFAPVAAADTATVVAGSFVVVNVLANDTVTGGVASVAVVNAPANGTAVVNPDSTINYTPNAAYTGPDTFTYQVTDLYAQSASASVSVTVTP